MLEVAAGGTGAPYMLKASMRQTPCCSGTRHTAVYMVKRHVGAVVAETGAASDGKHHPSPFLVGEEGASSIRLGVEHYTVAHAPTGALVAPLAVVARGCRLHLEQEEWRTLSEKGYHCKL